MSEKKLTLFTSTIIIFIIYIIFLSISGCGLKKQQPKEKKINIYVNIKDRESLSLMNTIIEDYKKKNTDVKVNINSVMEENIYDVISKKKDADIIITSRNNMIEMARKGILQDLESYYKSNDINDKYYNIYSAYGRYGDKNYGIPVNVSSIEIFYNEGSINPKPANSPATIKDMEPIIKKYTTAGMRIPVVVGEELDINDIIAGFIASNEVNIQYLGTAYDSGNMTYKGISEMQKVFDVIHYLVKSGIVNRDTFETGNENAINRFIKGEIPILICSSYYSSRLKNTDAKIVTNYNVISGVKGNVPVIGDAIMSVPTFSKNGEEIENFFKFMLSDDEQKKLSQKGIITANKKVNENLKGILGVISWHLMNADENSIIYIYNMPVKFKESISSKVNNILSQKYSGKEWQEIVDEVNKQ